MLKNCNYPESLHDQQVENAKNWLKAHEESWRLPDLNDDIVEYQEELENRYGRQYPKTEVYEAVQLIAETTVSIFHSLKKAEVANVMNSAIFLEPMFGSSLWHYTERVVEAMVLSHDLPWHKNAFYRLTSHFWKIGAILGANPDPRIIDAIQELIRADALGQDAASIIFSRTALELTLKSKVSRKILEKHLGCRSSAFEISDRIAVAHKMGILSDRNRKLAGKVRIRANQLTHEDVRLTESATWLVEDALRVIEVFLTKHDPYQAGEDLFKNIFEDLREKED